MRAGVQVVLVGDEEEGGEEERDKEKEARKKERLPWNTHSTTLQGFHKSEHFTAIISVTCMNLSMQM